MMKMSSNMKCKGVRSNFIIFLALWEIRASYRMPSNFGAGEDSRKSLGQQGDQTSQPEGTSTLNIHWKD